MEHNTNTSDTRDQILHIIENTADPDNRQGDTAAETAADVILAENVVIKRADLPGVVEDGDWIHVDGLRFRKDYESAGSRRQLVLRNVAIAEYLDAKKAREAEQAAEARLATRRDELATELVAAAYGESEFDRKYVRLSSEMQAAVDRIRELEDKLTEAQEAQA